MVLSKSQLLNALRAANIEPPATANLSQLRLMYDNCVRPEVNKTIHTADRDEQNLQNENDVNIIPPVHPDLEIPCVPVENIILEKNIVPVEIAAPVCNAAIVPNDDAAIDAELLRLEKIHQITRLRNELAAMNINHNDHVEQRVRRPEHTFAIADVQCAIAPFTGNDSFGILKWLNDFERLMDSFNVDVNSRLLYCRRLLNGDAAVLMRSLSCNSWDELKQELVNEFNQRVDRRPLCT